MTDWSESKKGRGRGQNDRLVREQERQGGGNAMVNLWGVSRL